MLTVVAARVLNNRLAQCFVKFPRPLQLGALRRSQKVQNEIIDGLQIIRRCPVRETASELRYKLRYDTMVAAYHLVWTIYGVWLPNDPRGSGSTEIRSSLLEELGEIHYGRKKIQPSSAILRKF